MRTILILLLILTTITAHAQEPLKVMKYRVKVEFNSVGEPSRSWFKSKYKYNIHQTGVSNNCKITVEKQTEHVVTCDIYAVKKQGVDVVFLVWVKEYKGFGPISKTKTVSKIVFPVTRTAYSDTPQGRFTVSFMVLE